MKKLDLATLSHKKAEIIKAEVGALLFNLGKTHIGFWNKKENRYFHADCNCFEKTYGYSLFDDYRKYYKDGSVNSPFSRDLESVNPKLTEFIEKTTLDFSFIQETVNLRDIICAPGIKKERRKSLSNIFLEGCEQINSGIDKGFPNDQLNSLWISNAVGSYKEDVNRNNLDPMRIWFYRKLWSLLSTLNLDNLTTNDWIIIRNFVFTEIENWYKHLLSDTRFPVNDVTLWEQVYMTASLFKATIAALTLDNSLYEKYKIPTYIRWSILGIQYDKLSLINKSAKAPFISWYRENINKCDKSIKKLIEEKYALGNEIYRDETGIYFVVPENLVDNTNKDGDFYKLSEELQEIKNDILKSFSSNFSNEIYPSILLTKPSRGIMNLAFLIEKAKKNYLKPDLPSEFSKITAVTKNKNFSGICQICRLMPGTKEDDLVLCKTCADGKARRLEKWFDDSGGETIWTGELQDRNGRIALVSLKSELNEWLNGNMLNTILINNVNWHQETDRIKKALQAIIEIKRIKGDDLNQYKKHSVNKEGLINFIKSIDNILSETSKTIKERFNINYDTKTFSIKKNKEENIENLVENNIFRNFIIIYRFQIFFDLANEAYIGCRNRGESIDDFLFQILFEPSIGDKWEKFIQNNLSNRNLINFQNRQINWQSLTNNDLDFLSRILLQFMIRKNPSPPRLRRIANMTLDYFNNIKKDLISFMFEENDLERDWRTKRLVWHSENMPKGQYEYNGLDFICDDSGFVYLITSIEQAIIIIAENKSPGYLETIPDKIRDGDISWILKEINGLKKVNTDASDNKTYILTRSTARYSRYLPYISITDPTPTLWQFIIPAEYLPKIINKIQQYYSKNFKYVAGKVPLHIGIIVQNYMKPLYVALSALRKISRNVEHTEDINKPATAINIDILTEYGFSNINPTESREGVEKLENAYSFYEVYHGDKNKKEKYQFYITPKENVWIDTIYNKPKDFKILIYPNTIDFEFLDVNTRKNDIVYKKDGSRIEPKSNRPYSWQEWKLFERFYDYFSKKDRTTKLHNIVYLIYSKIEDWKENEEILKDFILTSFKNIFDLNTTEALNQFASIFNFECWNSFRNLDASMFKKLLIAFIDMYEFWHKALKKL